MIRCFRRISRGTTPEAPSRHLPDSGRWGASRIFGVQSAAHGAKEWGMKITAPLLCFLLLAQGIVSSGLRAADTPASPEAVKEATAKSGDKSDPPKAAGKESEAAPKLSKGTVRVEGRELAYETQTGMMPIFKGDGTVGAHVFYVYYAALGEDGTRLCVKQKGTRPVMFCFNGGPGSSAVWLHLGGLGPRRVDTLLDGRVPASLAPLVENPNTVLDATDLVFIDPVNTGLSRAVKGEADKQFLGVEEDITAVAEFLRVFCTREKRWESPKLLCGESYGGIRGAGLAGTLLGMGMYLNGLQVVSGLLNYQTILGHLGNDLPSILALPTLTNVAHYHKKLSPELQADRPKAEAAARAFAYGDYAAALLRGNGLPAAERSRVVAELSRLTSLTPEQIEDMNLRLNRWAFRKLALKKDGKIVGGYDARVVALDKKDTPADQAGFDPSAAFVKGAVSAAVNAYVRDTLKFESDHPYRVMAPVDWNYTHYSNRFVSMESRLADALVQNPRLKVLLQVGRSDLVVPQDAMRYSIDQLPVPKQLLGNIRFEEYESGHMMYFHLPDAEKFRADTLRFIREACAP